MTKYARLVLFITLFLGALVTKAVAAQGAAYPDAPFAAIPGVTATEIAAIREIRKARPAGLIYGMMNSDESFIAEDGRVGGFTRLLCERLSRLFGIKFAPTLVGWDDLVKGLDSFQIDLSGELTSTSERQKKYYFSSPIAERGFTVYRHSSHPELDLINGQEPYRYGLFEGSVTYDRVLATSEIPFEPVFVQNYHEAAEAMRSGVVDAVICESMMDSAFESYPDITYQKYYPLAYTTVSMATVNPEILPIIKVFQKYLDAGGRRGTVRAEQARPARISPPQAYAAAYGRGEGICQPDGCRRQGNSGCRRV